MKNIIKALFAALAIAVLSGCATSLDKTATTVDWTKGSIVALSVELHNEYRPNYHPTHLGVVMIKKTGTDSRQRIPAISAIPVGTNTYLVTQQIQPGQYTLSAIYGISQKFPIRGGIDFSIDAPFEVAPNSVIYLGRISAVNKERSSNDDQSAGGPLPLIDQAISGYGNGTLSVVLKDNYDEDVKVLKREFIAVEKYDVVRSPLKAMTLERATGSRAALIEVNLPTAVVATQDAPAPTSPVAEK
jgi:hypothetical protein